MAKKTKQKVSYVGLTEMVAGLLSDLNDDKLIAISEIALNSKILKRDPDFVTVHWGEKKEPPPNPKHMSASDMIQQCDERDIVELVDKLVGNFLDRDKLRSRVLEIRDRDRADEKKGFTDALGQKWPG